MKLNLGKRRYLVGWGSLLPFMAIAWLSPPALGYEFEGVRLSRNPDHTRVVLDLDGMPDYRISELSQPPRVIIDLPSTALTGDLAALDLRATPLVDVHSETHNGSDLRIVLELDGTVLDLKSFDLEPHQKRGYRVVMDLLYRANVSGPDIQGGKALDTPSTMAVASSKNTAESVPAKSNSALRQISEPLTAGASSSELNGREVHAMEPLAEIDFNDEPGFGWRFYFGGTWEQEWAGYTGGGDSQKNEALIEPRLDIELNDRITLTSIARFRTDTIGDIGPEKSRPENYSNINGPLFNSAQYEFSLREIYLDAELGESYLRLGKQQVVWGQADGIKVLDVVNPQSFREFVLDDQDDSRIPLTMLNLEIPVSEDGTLQLLWIPDTTYHELAEEGTPYFFTSPKIVPQAPPGLATRVESFDKPDDPFRDSDAGARYSAYLGGWDVTLNYLYHYQDFPVLYQSLKQTPDGPEGVVAPAYERNHMLGGTLSNVLFGNLTLRAEFAHNSDTFHIASDLSQRGIENSPEFSGVIGLDWQLGSNTLVSGQYFHSHLPDYVESINRDENERNASLYVQQSFNNETLQFTGLLLYSLNHEDTWTQLKLKYLLRSNLELWFGADLFSGDRDGLFGQFGDTDRLLAGMRYGF